MGQYALPSQGYNLLTTEQTVQVSDTQIFGAQNRQRDALSIPSRWENQTPQKHGADDHCSVRISGGRKQPGNDHRHAESLRIAELHVGRFRESLSEIWRAAARSSRDNSSTANFNGTFTFPTLAAYQANAPEQFSLTTGSPWPPSNLFDAGLYVQDDWRWRPNVTLSSGLRFETQNHIPDHADLAPRFGLAWGIGQRKVAVAEDRAAGGLGNVLRPLHE